MRKILLATSLLLGSAVSTTSNIQPDYFGNYPVIIYYNGKINGTDGNVAQFVNWSDSSKQFTLVKDKDSSSVVNFVKQTDGSY